MRVLEVRDGFIKFDADESIYLSSFVLVKGENKNYIAQVIKHVGNAGYAKILFLLNNNNLDNYDKTLPAEDSEVVEFTSEIINNSIQAANPVIIGKTLNNILIETDLSIFNKKLLISVDGKDEQNIIIKNISKQFDYQNKKTIIIDTTGVVYANKYSAGTDFKLPLDKSSLAFMYQECLNDATSDSKTMIIDIFKDLSEYSESVPFVPFGTLKTIVDEMVDKSHIFKLLVLKNKLQKLSKLGYFAQTAEEVKRLDSILDSKCAIIDLSKLDIQFQNYFLSYIYEKMSKQPDTNVILEISNSISKKNLKNIICDSNVNSTIIAHSNFKYLNDIKNYFDNFIITDTLLNNKVFDIYSTFLKSMQKNTYLVVGEGTNYIPLISKLENIEDKPEMSNAESIPTSHTEDSNDEDDSIENLAKDIFDTETPVVNKESIEYTDNDYIDEISLDDESIEETESLSTSDIIANIDQRTENVIANVTENYEMPENVSMFDDELSDEANNEVTEENNSDTDLSIDDLETDPDVLNSNEENIDNPVVQEENEIIDADEISDDTTKESLLTEDELEFSDNIINSEEEPLQNDFEEQTDEVEELNVSDMDILDDISETADVSVENSDDSLQMSETIINDDDYSLSNSMNDESIIDNDAQIENSELNNDIVEIDNNDILEPDVFIDIENDIDDISDNIENIDEEIIKDVDKVYTTRNEDDISDNDLDLIDELNSSEINDDVNNADDIEEYVSSSDNEGIIHKEEQLKEDIIEDTPEILETKGATTPIVPVYDADIPPEDMVVSDPIQQGDAVTHVKYGSGVVEKMIKYGNKTLYSINFDNIGRRLLDPTLTEIKKV